MPSSPLPTGGLEPRVVDTPRGWRVASFVLVGASICAIAAGGGYWAGRRSRPPPIEVRIPTPTQVAPVTAQVAGAVASPGVFMLAPGSRVNDLIAAAGGLLTNADPAAINLAAKVSDGQRVLVPTLAPAGMAIGPRQPEAALSSSTAGMPLDLNRATADDLASLPRIGPVTAAAIVRWRETNGDYHSVEDLLGVPGIGQATLDAIRSMVTAE
ncbi:MAG: helix-hairpin-helix domain-containing protein [Chloroflexi bacterium]|nr:helix-hairpin-helix domain-containing protein [Chloroflexota bacterium]